MKFLFYLLLSIVLLHILQIRTVTCQDADTTTEIESSDEYDDYDIEDYDINEILDSVQEQSFYTLPSNNDLVTTTYYVDYNSTSTPTLPTGKEITVLIGVSNSGKTAYNLTYMQLSLLSAYDKTFHIQNFSLIELKNAIVSPTQDITLDYKLYADPTLESTDYYLTGILLFNNSANRIYKNSIVNQRIKLIDTHSTYFDFQTITAVLMSIGLLIGTMYGVLLVTAPKLLSGSNKSKRIKSTAAAVNNNVGSSRKKKQ